MIREDMVIPVGKLKKPHGYKGQVGVDIFFDKNLFSDSNTPFFVKIDNTLVPFFVDTIGGGPNGMSFLKFKDIDSDTEASIFSQKDLFVFKSVMAELLGVPEDEIYQENDNYTGYKVIDSETRKNIGTVIEIFEGVEYDYLVVEKSIGQQTIEIPLVEEFIEEINETAGGQGVITVMLPSGFLDI